MQRVRVLSGLGRRLCGNTQYGLKQAIRTRPLVESTVRYCSSADDIPREGLPISRFPIPERSTLPQDIRERLDEEEEKGGFLANVFKALMYRPDEFRAFFNYYDILMDTTKGSLTKAEKEMIVIATSASNNCLYCVVAHSALHRVFSKKRYVADQLATNWESADLTPREKAIVKFAMSMSQCQSPTEEDFCALGEHGLSRDDAWDIGAISAFFALSNRMAFLTGMRPNEEFYLLGRVKREKESTK